MKASFWTVLASTSLGLDLLDGGCGIESVDWSGFGNSRERETYRVTLSGMMLFQFCLAVAVQIVFWPHIRQGLAGISGFLESTGAANVGDGHMFLLADSYPGASEV
jgi:hypothetical protein